MKTLTLPSSLRNQQRRPAPKPKSGPPRRWVIWRRNGSRPKVIHTNLRDALAEVARLRQLCPDERYDIFELVPLSRNTGLRR